MSEKISALPAVTTPTLADLIPTVQAGDNYKMTLDQLRQALGQPLRFGQTLTQSGSDDPVVGNTLVNTMGGMVGVVWTRTNQGEYTATFSGISFADLSKLVVLASEQESASGALAITPVFIQIKKAGSTAIVIYTSDVTSFSAIDGVLSHYIEFQYYDV